MSARLRPLQRRSSSQASPERRQRYGGEGREFRSAADSNSSTLVTKAFMAQLHTETGPVTNDSFSGLA
jgi:hypothetical protein